ncbi:MAG TPA: hypothetical protein VN688_15970 [Gemmataceae bacterium]|nr:hypothetical protein [Gemmataceae bacterium]
MYAISIDQPHATTILTGPRPFHYPSWRTDHRGLLLIHARKMKTTRDSSASVQGMSCNALVGVVELMDCIAFGHPDADPDEIEYHWVLANPRIFARPLPYIGRLGLFQVSDEVVAAALKDAESSAPPLKLKRRGAGAK